MKHMKRYRKKVDEIDVRLLALLNQRARLSQQIGELKRAGNKAIYAPDREREVLERLDRLNRGPVQRQALHAIYREIMSGSLRLEKDLQIAYLGPEYTFTHQASHKRFGSSVSYVACTNISDVFANVQQGLCEYGVVPVENSTEGAIYHTLDSFVDSDVKICSEIILRIDLNLLSMQDSLKSIKRIYSNPQVFGQCRRWLERNVPGVEQKGVPSTAQAALLAQKEKRSACIASWLIARNSPLRVLGRSIEDSAHNTTRFLVISREFAKRASHNKTSMMLSIKDRVGGLRGILEIFAKEKINLTKIESRPSRQRNWEYYFFVDFEAHLEDRRVKRLLKALYKECTFVKILGSYPKAV